VIQTIKGMHQHALVSFLRGGSAHAIVE